MSPLPLLLLLLLLLVGSGRLDTAAGKLTDIIASHTPAAYTAPFDTSIFRLYLPPALPCGHRRRHRRTARCSYLRVTTSGRLRRPHRLLASSLRGMSRRRLSHVVRFTHFTPTPLLGLAGRFERHPDFFIKFMHPRGYSVSLHLN